MNIKAGPLKANTHVHFGGRRLPWWAGVGLAILGIGTYGLVEDIPVLNVLWYAFAWYGYLLLLDAATLLISGRSLLVSAPGRVVSYLFWSVPFWFFFELYNVRLENWYYVYTFRPFGASLAFSLAAFATVLPACFFHSYLLESLKLWEQTRWDPIDPSRGWIQTAWVLGIFSCTLPLIFPHAAFWMVWGALAGIPEAVAYRVGASSLLRDLEFGRPARFLRLLVGGMIAGMVWEGLNYWARCKWIYTVPGMEDWKLFEMPVLGFLGFPILALSAHATYALIEHVTKDRWISLKRAIVLLGVVITVGGHSQMIAHSVKSYRPLLSEFEGMTKERRQSLDVTSVEDLAEKCESSILFRESSDWVSTACAVSVLALHKGMGIPRARALVRTGVRHVRDLRSVDAIHDSLKPEQPTLTRKEVSVWVRAAGENYRR